MVDNLSNLINKLWSFFRVKKNLTNFIFLLILVLAIPLGIELVRREQLLRSRAVDEPIAFLEGECVSKKDGKLVAKCQDITLKLISSLGPPGTPAPSPSLSPSSTSSASPTPTVSPTPTPPADPNVALGKKAEQSSTEKEECSASSKKKSKMEAELAIDSKKDGECTEARTSKGKDEWWRVDLEGNYLISKIVIYPQTEEGGKLFASEEFPVKLQYGLKTNNWIDIETFTSTEKNLIATPSSQITARYIRILKEAKDKKKDEENGKLGLLEVEVYGKQSSASFLNLLFKTVLAQEPSPTGTPKPEKNSILGTVFMDLDKNGTKSATESGVAGVQIKISDKKDDSKVATASTDVSGKYTITKIKDKKLSKKKYIVKLEKVPITGFTSTTPDKVEIDVKGAETVNFGIFHEASASASPSPTPPASPSPTPVGNTAFFVIAEDPLSLASADKQPYTNHPLITDFELKNNKPGTKTVFVKFFGAKGEVSPVFSKSITFVAPDPTISSAKCSLSSFGSGINIELKGSGFGDSEGKMTLPDWEVPDAAITSWKEDSISATVNFPEGFVFDENVVNFLLKRKDGAEMEGSCGLAGATSLALGSKLMCRAPSQNSTQNVELIIAEDSPTVKPKKQIVSIDKNGVIQDIEVDLVKDKRYQVSVKAPKSLRRTSKPFVAEDATIQLLFNRNIGNDIHSNRLPIGDIYPLGDGDGKINALDANELYREWGQGGSSLEASPIRPADFNQDGKVNSIDWACMRYDFNQLEDPPLTGVDQ